MAPLDRGKLVPRLYATTSITAFAVLSLLLAGCAATDPGNIFSPASDFAAQLGDLFSLIIWIAAVIFVAVEGVLIYALVRFRARAGQGRPPQVHGNTRLEIAWTIAPAIVLAAIAIPTIATIFRTYSEPPSNALKVTVIGHQWWWEAQYPDLGIVTANEIHVPVGRPVAYRLQSADVIHSFWVPRLTGKRDMIPNRTSELWFSVDEEGPQWGQCAEFCGAQHADMRLQIVADSSAGFDAWVRSEQTAPPTPSGAAAEGQQLFSRSACVGCHTIQGVSQGKVGPNLTHLGSRRYIAAGVLENTPENLRRWLQAPQEVKPGNLMPALGLTDAQAQSLATYLESLK